jgi:hypothetical protein
MPHCRVPSLPLAELPVVSVGEAAALLRSCPSQIYILLGRGLLISTKVGARRLIHRASIDQLLGKRASPQPTADPPSSPPQPRRRGRGASQSPASERVCSEK